MMKKNLTLLISVVLAVFMFPLVSAGDFKIQNSSGSDIFTVATSGNVNASGTLAENGLLLSEIYLALSGGALTGNLSSNNNMSADTMIADYFIGDGSRLTNVGFTNTNIAYFNNTVTWTGAQQITAALNITGNITGADYINANYFVGAGSKLTSLPDDMATIKYQNVSNWPTCGAGEHLDYDGSALTCTADSGTFTNTNLAYVNETNNFTVAQLFDADIKLNDTAVITREGQETTNITIDASGNVIISLG